MKISPDFVYQNIDWMRLKLKINLSERKVFPRRKEIWWVSLGKNIGVEIDGKHSSFERPVLVINAFGIDSFLVVSLTSQPKIGKYYFDYINNDNQKRVINLSQLRTVSCLRFIRKIEVIDDNNFQIVIDKIKNYLV